MWRLLVLGLLACRSTSVPEPYAPPVKKPLRETSSGGSAASRGGGTTTTSSSGSDTSNTTGDGSPNPTPTPGGSLAAPTSFDANILPAWFIDHSDTSTATDHAIDSYAGTTASGGEIYYTFTTTEPAKITITLANTAAAHNYVALLSALPPNTALFNDLVSDTKIDTSVHALPLSYLPDGDLDPGEALAAGTYFIVVDAANDASAGAFELRVRLALMPTACDANTFPTPNGTPSEVAYDPRCPPGMVHVPSTPDYCVDKYEAMLVGVDGTGSAFAWSPYENPGAQKTRALSVASKVPQAYMSKYNADAACSQAGKRLCTYREWLRACEGSQGTTYPYGGTREQNVNPAALPAGFDWQKDACDDGRFLHTAVEYFSYFGEGDSGYVFSHLTHPCIDQIPNGLDPSGWRVGCVSEDGAFDMMGNVHEWIDERDVGSASGGTKSVPAGHGAFAGGWYLDTYLNGAGCTYLTTAHTPDQIDESTGFRCCADATQP